jgi:hypothetical protein
VKDAPATRDRLWSTAGLRKHQVRAQLVGPCPRRSGGVCCPCLIVRFPSSRFRSEDCVKSRIRLNATPSSFGTGGTVTRSWGSSLSSVFSQCFETSGQHPAMLPPCRCIKMVNSRWGGHAPWHLVEGCGTPMSDAPASGGITETPDCQRIGEPSRDGRHPRRWSLSLPSTLASTSEQRDPSSDQLASLVHHS